MTGMLGSRAKHRIFKVRRTGPMNIRTEFPHKIREIENEWIALSDGTRLAARIWLPEGAEEKPVPAIFEFLPYRKSDGTAHRDALRQPYFAGHGYAAVRVDIRGTGESDGILYDEYLKQEQDDALELLAWIADQPWCDGSIGMHGISWGGFNSLQVAARQPPQLKAILVIGFTDDRYADDVHYMGGCVLGVQMLAWSSVMFAYNAAPPDPKLVGDRWREMWLERMEKTPPYVETWLSHQRRDSYWKHGSVGESYDAIKVPVYAVGGWADSYNNSVPRLLAGLSGPRKGLIGPWCHTFPEMGPPGPVIGFLQEMVRWWDHWLKGIDTGIMDEPIFRSWIQDSVPPAINYEERPGHWVADPSWPSPYVQEQTHFLNHNGGAASLAQTPEAEHAVSFKGRQSHGLDGGQWGAYGQPGEYPGDQQAADGESLSFTSTPLTAPVEILGYPEVDLALAVDQPNALAAVRLCDVSPTGASALVSYGLLNLTHRESHEFPTPLEPGKRYQVTVQLNVSGYKLPAGHRWRVSVSPTYWRHAWPSPAPVTLTLFAGEGCRLRLPVRPPQAADTELPSFGPAENCPPLAAKQLRTAALQQLIERDIINGRTTFSVISDDGRIKLIGSGMETDDRAVETYTILEDDPLSADVSIQRTLEYQRDDWRVRIETDSRMTSDATHFHVNNVMDAYEGTVRVFSKSWDFSVPRDHV